MVLQDQDCSHLIDHDRVLWVQMAKGSAEICGELVKQGDGTEISKERVIDFKAIEKAEILLFNQRSKL